MNFTPKAPRCRLPHLMASADQRLPENVPGRFYVTSECIDCNFCRDHAPAFFSRHDEIGFSIVHRQPVTDAEIELAEEAVASCPTDAIGNDGVAPAAPAVPGSEFRVPS